MGKGNPSQKKYGVIYRIIGPNGESYIGQTKRPFLYRLSQHINGALNQKAKHRCTALYNAIRQYGWEKFKFRIILHQCELNMLNYWEKYYINHYNSIYPYGYNLTTGGSRSTEYSEKSKLKMSDSRRKNGKYYDITKNLPKGIMIHTENDIPTGFTVVATDTIPQAKFWNSKNKLEENLMLALEYQKNGKKQDKECPRFIQKTNKGYIVNCRIYVNGKTIRYGYKRYENTSLSFEVKYQKALNYLNKIKELYKI